MITKEDIAKTRAKIKEFKDDMKNCQADPEYEGSFITNDPELVKIAQKVVNESSKTI